LISNWYRNGNTPWTVLTGFLFGTRYRSQRLSFLWCGHNNRRCQSQLQHKHCICEVNWGFL